jgi:hypothetical protein
MGRVKISARVETASAVWVYEEKMLEWGGYLLGTNINILVGYQSSRI